MPKICIRERTTEQELPTTAGELAQMLLKNPDARIQFGCEFRFFGSVLTISEIVVNQDAITVIFKPVEEPPFPVTASML